jgi:hypothetical protein
VLRMQMILTSIAGRVFLAQDGNDEQRKAYERLRACESINLGDMKTTTKTPAPLAPFPSYDEERQLAETVLPGWMGIRFSQANSTVRMRFSLKNGASVVLAVYPDSHAQQAGIEVGDIILGPPDNHFAEQNQVREWVMTAPIGTPTTLQVLRGDQSLLLALIPQRYPMKWPSLPGPPKIGSDMPLLRELKPYRGTLPAKLGYGGPYLLFFWATWCEG